MLGARRRLLSVSPPLVRALRTARHASIQLPGFPAEDQRVRPPVSLRPEEEEEGEEEEDDEEYEDGEGFEDGPQEAPPNLPYPTKGFLQPEPLPRTHNHPVALLHFRSYRTDLLGLFMHFALHSAVSLGIPTSGVASLPTQRNLWTVLKSPFVHKSAQENFERKTHKRAIKVFDADPEVLELYISYLEKHALAGVGIRVTRWTRVEVGFGKNIWDAMARGGMALPEMPLPQEHGRIEPPGSGDDSPGAELWSDMVESAQPARKEVESMVERIVEVEMQALKEQAARAPPSPPPPAAAASTSAPQQPPSTKEDVGSILSAPPDPEAALAASLHPVPPTPSPPGPSTAGSTTVEAVEASELYTDPSADVVDPSIAGVDTPSSLEPQSTQESSLVPPEPSSEPDPSTAGPATLNASSTTPADFEPLVVDHSTSGVPSEEAESFVLAAGDVEPVVLQSGADVPSEAAEHSVTTAAHVDPPVVEPSPVDISSEQADSSIPSPASIEVAPSQPTTAGIAESSALPEAQVTSSPNVESPEESVVLHSTTTTSSDDALDVREPDPSTAGLADSPEDIAASQQSTTPSSQAVLDAHEPDPSTPGPAESATEGAVSSSSTITSSDPVGDVQDPEPVSAGPSEPAEDSAVSHLLSTTDSDVVLDVQEPDVSTAGPVVLPIEPEATLSPTIGDSAGAITSAAPPAQAESAIASSASSSETAQAPSSAPVSPQGTETQTEVLARDEPMSGGSATEEMPQPEAEVAPKRRGRPRKVVVDPEDSGEAPEEGEKKARKPRGEKKD